MDRHLERGDEEDWLNEKMEGNISEHQFGGVCQSGSFPSKATFAYTPNAMQITRLSSLQLQPSLKLDYSIRFQFFFYSDRFISPLTLFRNISISFISCLASKGKLITVALAKSHKINKSSNEKWHMVGLRSVFVILL